MEPADSSSALQRARALYQQEKALRAAIDAFGAAHPVLDDAPYADLVRVREDLRQRARVCGELEDLSAEVYAAAARQQVLAHQAPCSVAAATAALDAAATAGESGAQNAFVDAVLRVHVETGRVPAPAGDGLGNEADNICVKCGCAADCLSISPEPGSATSGGVHCAQGVPNQCTCFTGRVYRACVDCWGRHIEEALAENVRRAIAGGELSCCVPCLVCGDRACAFRIKKSVVVVVVPTAPPAPVIMDAAPQQQQQQQVAYVPPPQQPSVPPPAIGLGPGHSLDLGQAGGFASYPPGNTTAAWDASGDVGFSDLSGDVVEALLGCADDFDQSGAYGYGDVLDPSFLGSEGFSAGLAIPGSHSASPVGVPGAAEAFPQPLPQPQPQPQSQPDFEKLGVMLDDLATCLKGMNARNAASAKAVRDLVGRFRDPLAYTAGGVGKRATPPASPAKPARRRGARSNERACRYCDRVGHNIRGCPKKKADIQEAAQKIVAERDQQQSADEVVVDAHGVVA